MNRLNYILTIAVLVTVCISCKQQSTKDIVIGYDLYIHQDYSESRKLRRLIKHTLNQDKKALSDLIYFPCAGGAGCYDLGFVITQIIYRIGESNFLKLIEKIDKEKYPILLGFIRVGLEYGDHDKDGNVDNRKIENEFPGIYERIN